MPSCCYGDEYNSMFTPQEANRTAKRFRRRGLSRSTTELAEAVRARIQPGATLIEVGGGVGELQVALLEAGVVDRALNVEMSTSWEPAAASLLADRRLTDRVERIVGDFVDLAESIPSADVLLMHRVLCCYPDWEKMLSAARSRAKSLIGITLPDDRWTSHIYVRVSNLLIAARRMRFRGFIHPVGRMVETMEGSHFRVGFDRAHHVWRTIVFERN